MLHGSRRIPYARRSALPTKESVRVSESSNKPGQVGWSNAVVVGLRRMLYHSIPRSLSNENITMRNVHASRARHESALLSSAPATAYIRPLTEYGAIYVIERAAGRRIRAPASGAQEHGFCAPLRIAHADCERRQSQRKSGRVVALVLVARRGRGRRTSPRTTAVADHIQSNDLQCLSYYHG